MRTICVVALTMCLSAATAKAACTDAVPTAVEKATNGLRVVVAFTCTDGTKTQTFLVGSQDDLLRQAAAYKASQNVTAVELPKIAIGQPLPDPTPTAPPTADQLAAIQFFTDLSQAKSVKAAVDAGLVPSTKAYTDLLAKVLSEFVEAYVTNPGWPR